jgi:hypothetical protein
MSLPARLCCPTSENSVKTKFNFGEKLLRRLAGSATLNRGQAACSTSSSHFGFLPRHLDSSAGGTGYVNNSSIDQR